MNCLYCGKPLKITFGHQTKYCNTLCKKNYYSEKYKKNRGPLYCKCCGNLLTGKQRKFCSEECKNSYNYGIYRNPVPVIKAQEPKKRGRPKKMLSLAEVSALARKEGLTYGKYCEKHNLY